MPSRRPTELTAISVTGRAMKRPKTPVEAASSSPPPRRTKRTIASTSRALYVAGPWPAITTTSYEASVLAFRGA